MPTVLKNAPLTEWLEQIRQIAQTAAKLLADIYQGEKKLTVQLKPDHSPLTYADMVADQYIRDQVTRLTPDIPIVTEETLGTLHFPQPLDAVFWLVDPLDGTKEFINRTGEFTVNIALITRHQPILGVVAVPLTQSCYWAIENGGAFFQEKQMPPVPLQVNITPGDTLTIAISRSHCTAAEYTTFIDAARQWHLKVSLLIAGSALKICLVAQGHADIYPRFGPTHAWDTAAGHIILKEAQGHLIDLKGHPLQYGQRDTLINPAFIATTPYYLPKILTIF